MTDAPTPLDRVQRLCATDLCECCQRFTALSPDDLAARLGVSATTVRRLADPAYVPGWPALGKIAAAVGFSPVSLVAALWPHLSDGLPDPEPDTCTGCRATPGQKHADDCTVYLASVSGA